MTIRLLRLWVMLLIVVLVVIVMFVVVKVFVQVSAATAHSAAYEGSFAPARQTSDQGAAAGPAYDGSIPLPPVLILVPGGYWLVVSGRGRLETGRRCSYTDWRG